MLIKPLYEILPYTYMIVGAASVPFIEQPYIVVASILVFFYGAHVWNLRSRNRRTDKKRKRVEGYLPDSIYGFMPFIYIISAVITFRFFPQDSAQLLSIGLFTYGGYILLRRISYRCHKHPSRNIKAKFR